MDCPTSTAEAIHVCRVGAGHHPADAGGAATHACGHFSRHQHSSHQSCVDLQWPATSGDGAAHHLQRRTRRHHPGERRRAHRIAILVGHRRHQGLLSTARQHSNGTGPDCRHLANLLAIPPAGNHAAAGNHLFGVDRAGHPDRPDQRYSQRTAAFRFRQLLYPHAAGDRAGCCHALPLRWQAARHQRGYQSNVTPG